MANNVALPPGLPRPEHNAAPLYKPLWQNNNLFVSISPWCDYYKYDVNMGEYHRMTKEGPLDKGTYHVTLEAPYIYIGTHKGGHLFTLTPCVIQLVYQPEPSAPALEPSIANPLEVENKPKKRGGNVSVKAKKAADTKASVTPTFHV